MPKRINSLTSAQKARMPEWRDKWIANGLSCAPMTADDRRNVEASLRAMYRFADQPEPKAAVFVPSPLVLRLAAGIAAGAIYARENGWPRDAVRDAVSDAVSVAVDDAVRGAVDVAVGGAVRDAVRGAVDVAVGGAVRDAVSGAVDVAVDGAVRDAVGGAVRDAVSVAVHDAVSVAVDVTVGGAVRDAVSVAVDVAVRDAVDVAVGGAVRGAVRDAVDVAVGGAVRDAVRDAVSGAVDDAVRGAVRDAVGGAVQFLLLCAQRANWMERGGNLWSSFPAWCSFFRDVAELQIPEWNKFGHLETTQSACGPYVVHKDFAMVSDRPEVIRRDAGGRLHAEDGMAIRWRDGSGFCFWHGLRLPRTHEWIVKDKERLTAGAIDGETNTELRRVMLEAFGFDRYLEARGALVVGEDNLHGQPRRLLEITIHGEPLRVVEVVNGSDEPDGTRRKFVLGAARRESASPNSPAEAIANSYGIRPERYREAVRT